jgi:hypothetical protein
MEESMPGLEASVELVNLSMWVEIAFDLAGKMRRAWAAPQRFEITREEEHRLVDACNTLADILDVAPHDVWDDYVESPWCPMCGHGCACGEGL